MFKSKFCIEHIVLSRLLLLPNKTLDRKKHAKKINIEVGKSVRLFISRDLYADTMSKSKDQELDDLVAQVRYVITWYPGMTCTYSEIVHYINAWCS